MTMKTCALALTAALLAVSCSQVLGFKDPKLDDTQAPPVDAANDAAPTDATLIDAAVSPIDAPPIDGPPIDAPPTGPKCVPASCPFGCDTATDMCRVGKLWVYPTAGAFVGNGFGGTAVPPDVRGGADARCLQTYTDSFSALQCNHARVHAVISINAASDSINLMASKFSIPTDVEVHRADDNVLVANNWNDLTDTTKQPRAPVTTAPDDDSGIIWSGFNSASNCKGWTSAAAAPDFGVRGHTTLTAANWLSRDSNTCDQFGRLLCVCWSGGE